jgi:steroid delta-isomerase-like uncharacterized protein
MATTPRENKELGRRFVTEIVNGRNYDLAEELFTADYTRHDPDTPADEEGPAPFAESLKQLHDAFPDGEVHVGESIAEDDLVAIEGTITGTHEGDFKGIEPTQQTIEIPGIAMQRIRDGQIAETWATWDFLGVHQQVGELDRQRA